MFENSIPSLNLFKLLFAPKRRTKTNFVWSISGPLGSGFKASWWSCETDCLAEWNEPTPMSLWHCDPELCKMQNSYASYHSRKNVHISFTIVCLWRKFGGLLCPRGTSSTPLRGMFSHSLPASNVVTHMFLRNSRSELWNIKVGHNVKSMGFFARFFAHCANIVRQIVYKSHSTPLLKNLHDLAPLSKVYDKWCRTSYICFVLNLPLIPDQINGNTLMSENKSYPFSSFCLPSGLWGSSPARQTHSLWGWCRCSRCWAPASGAPPRWASVQWRWGAYGLSPAYVSYRGETERDSEGNEFLLVNFSVYMSVYTEIKIFFFFTWIAATSPTHVKERCLLQNNEINLIQESQEFFMF